MKYFIEKYQQNRDEVHRVARYLIIGGWNTLFGLGLYTLLYETFKGQVNYLLLTIPCNILAITNAFLCYKIFVFKTKGKWWSEYFRCYLVYGSSTLIGMGLMFVLVSGFNIYPVIAQFLTVAITIVASYIGHREFSFAKNKDKVLDEAFSKSMHDAADLAKIIRGKSLFLTGGTGFFGKCLLAGIDYLNRKYDADIKTTVLSRNPPKFIKNYPEFDNLQGLSFIQGDIRSFEFPNEHFDYFIHGATDIYAKPENDIDDETFSVIIEGTSRVLECCHATGVKRLLFVSSGAVYGQQPPDIYNMPENYINSTDFVIPDSAYGKGKLIAEKMCIETAIEQGFQTLIARPFAFVGPYLPLDAHFAAGNFIQSALKQQSIIINGDGTPLRSYMYSTDLVNWLLTILLKGESGRAYNIGSDQPVSILELAQSIAANADDSLEIVAKKIPDPNQTPAHYVPDTSRAKNELGLEQNFEIDQSLAETISWHRKRDI